MSSVFHAGELENQRRAGVLDDARSVGRIVAGSMSAPVARFLSRQRLAIASSKDAEGRVWASPLTGTADFINPVDEKMLWLKTRGVPGDPLADNLRAAAPMGLLVIDPQTRQRMRFNGRGVLQDEGIFVELAQVYGNCPKYIQLRRELPDGTEAPDSPQVGSELTSSQQAWITTADTLFIASLHPTAGADASHRGGKPGFVQLENATRLSFPDFQGNAMFNTLGNLVVNPKAGLLFQDFEHGRALQLTGRAQVTGDRRVIFDIDECRETPHAVSLRYRLVEYSPALPADACHAPA